MIALSIGLTDVYNRFHDPAIDDVLIYKLRELHACLDRAVCDAYGWNDIDLGHDFHSAPYLPKNDRMRYTICEPARLEVLRRLSRLNRERWQGEQDEALAAVRDVEAARLAMKSPRRNSGPTLKLVADPKQPRLF